ncbi:MAG: hypothetical protein ACXQS5_01225 [Candidatus Methanospirareceae archaeon]
MVSVFLEAVPANMLVARAVCKDNEANNATFFCVGMLIRIRGDKKLVLNRAIIERAIGRGLTENEWQSVTWNYIGVISKSAQNELVFEDSEESKVMDEYWDKQLASLKSKT